MAAASNYMIQPISNENEYDENTFARNCSWCAHMHHIISFSEM